MESALFSRLCAIAQERGLAISKIERECGLTNATIRRWATQNPSLDSVQRVAQYLNISLDYLAGNSEQAHPVCDNVPLSQMESDVIAMLRLLNEHDRKNAVDFITMLYEQTTGEKGSVYSTYIEDENEQTKRAVPLKNSRDGIA